MKLGPSAIERRSYNMAQIKGRDTKPELTVRRLLHSLGYRYRLHDPRLPGRPDIVFVGRHKVVFVHGCFWHRHLNCKFAYTPKSRVEFWCRKFEQNKARDARDLERIAAQGWEALVLWECEIGVQEALQRKLVAFLEGESTLPAKVAR